MKAQVPGEDDVILQLGKRALGDVVKIDLVFLAPLLEPLRDIGGNRF